jgi:hypothetical protein
MRFNHFLLQLVVSSLNAQRLSYLNSFLGSRARIDWGDAVGSVTVAPVSLIIGDNK